MKSLFFSFTILASFAALFSAADARRFNVGGNGVWVINPQENYKTWAERNRFQVNDTLYFKYVKGADSVQEVMKADFDGCNVKNPLKKFDNGESDVTLDRSGPFFFISGNEDHCKKGQKLIVIVLAVRNHTTVPISPAKPPTMAHPPKSPSPVSPAKPPSRAHSPKSPSPVSPISPANPPSTAQPPKSSSPVSPISPSKPPSTSQPPKSPSPVSPAKSPAKSAPPKSSSSPVSHSPAVSPSHAPAKSPKIPSPSPKSPSPVSVPSPSNPPKSSMSPGQAPIPPSPEESQPSSSPSPSEITPAADNITAPAPSPRRNAASGLAVNSVMATVLPVALTLVMFA